MGFDNEGGKTVCEEIREKILCEKELSDAEKAHILSCGDCRTYADEIKTMLSDLESIGKESENLEKDGKTLVSSVMNEINARKFFGNTGKKGGFSPLTKHFGLAAACVVLLIMAFPLIRNYGKFANNDAVVSSDSTEEDLISVPSELKNTAEYITKTVKNDSLSVEDGETEFDESEKSEKQTERGAVKSAPGGISLGAAPGASVRSAGTAGVEESGPEESAVNSDINPDTFKDSASNAVYGKGGANGLVIVGSESDESDGEGSPDAGADVSKHTPELYEAASDGVGLYVRSEGENDDGQTLYGVKRDDAENTAKNDDSGMQSKPVSMHYYDDVANTIIAKFNAMGKDALLIEADKISPDTALLVFKIESSKIEITIEYDEESKIWKISKESESIFS